MTINLDRFLHSSSGTLGILTTGGRSLAFTLEPPDDVPEGPIPCGRYPIRWRMVGRIARLYQSRGFVGSLEVCRVPGRSEIEIHAGNSERDTRGCILLGLSVDDVRSPLSVMRSRPAVHAFYTETGRHLLHGDVWLQVMAVS